MQRYVAQFLCPFFNFNIYLLFALILSALQIYSDLQYAGRSLKQLQQALKNPAANMGTLLGVGAKRARR